MGGGVIVCRCVYPLWDGGMVSRLLLLILLAWQSVAIAEVYKIEDADGVRYSDRPSVGAKAVNVIDKIQRYKYEVKRIYDGDTITLENGKRVRLLGINTPEIESHYRQGEDGGQNAKQWLKDKLQEGSVFLEYDIQKRDKYGRSLAHLFSVDGKHMNKELVQAGLAVLSIIPPNVRYADELIKAEKSAQQQDLGIWGMESYQAISINQLSKEKISGWHRFLAAATKIKRSRKYVRLTLSDTVDIRIPIANLTLFPELDNYLEKPLEIRGWASRRKKHFSILVRHPSAIIFIQ